MAAAVTQLPEGFVLDAPPPAALPEGFIIDAPKQPPVVEPAPTDNQFGLTPENAPGAFAQGTPDPQDDGDGLFQRIGGRVESRGAELDEIRQALAAGDQTFPESVGQVIGKTIAGTALDVGGELLESGFETVGEIVSAITPDFLEQPIVEGTTEALEWALGSEIGQLGIEAARSGVEAYEQFKTENPRAARNIESVMNIGLVLAPASSALKVGSKTPRFTKQELADAPDAEALFKKSTEKFKKVRQSGSVLDSDTFVDFMADFERAFSKQIDPALHPRLTGTLNLLERRIGDDIDIDDLLILRRNIGEVGKSLSPDEQRLGRNLLRGFDDFVENLPGTPDWIKARKLYSRGIKTELLEDAILQAGKTASGLENGLRIEFRKLLNSKRKAKRFTKDERAAMEKVIEGDFTTNTLKKIGGLGFGRGQQRSPLTGLAGVAVGGEIAGGAGAVAAPVIGRISQGLAADRTLRAANTAKALTAGVRPAPVPRLGPTIKRAAIVSAIGGGDDE